MIPRILITAALAAALTACGSGSSGSSGSSGNNGNNSGDNGDGGGGTVITGEAGDFGDSADADNSVRGTYTLCPAGTRSFSIFAETDDGWCVPGCPAEFENDDGDEFGSFLAENNTDRYTCFITSAAPGSSVNIFFSAPIDGCPPPAGCPPGTFPPVFISAAAGDELAGDYSCADWRFDVDSQDWSEQTTPAPFSLTLNVDRSAVINGTNTTWSFSSGTLALEGNQSFNNVAVGDGSFTVYKSNIAITRCRT